MDDDSTSRNLDMRFFGSVLHMRGSSLTIQPLRSDSGSVFLWNGEVFDGFSVSIRLYHLYPNEVQETDDLCRKLRSYL